MLMEVQELCDRVDRHFNDLLDELQDLTGRYGDEERRAWQASLKVLSGLLARPQLASFRECHVYVESRGNLSLEYRLPSSSSWCDVVLLGRKEASPSAVLIELKHWDTAGDRPGPSESLVEHAGQLKLHPSDQVRGYTEYCRRFHSTVHDTAAELTGCVYFTRAVPIHAYIAPPHDELTRAYPVFSNTTTDTDVHFPQFLATCLERPDVEFARRFEDGIYRQDRNFCLQMASQIEDPMSSPFELLDEQRRGFELCCVKIHEALRRSDPQDGKAVVIIEGPPGSGKSVIAARLWAEMVRQRIGNVVLTTTSSSQLSNWKRIFWKLARSHASAGVIMPANQYKPETIQWVGKIKKQGKRNLEPEHWRENVEFCRQEQGQLRCRDDSFDVSIVDEAHALINPEQPKARAGPTGWPIAFGPQAYHIIRASLVTIFLLDSDQSFRDRETTSKEDIERLAREQGAAVISSVSLAGQQFRAAGSVPYMDWLEGCLGLRTNTADLSWRKISARNTPIVNAVRYTPSQYGKPSRTIFRDGAMLFEIVEDPIELETSLRRHAESGDTVRLVASYSRPWLTKKMNDPHSLPPKKRDFDIPFVRDGLQRRWSKIWNFAPSADYTFFVQAPPGTKMHQDPLSEVGCPYVVRGFDYAYLGVLWLEDLVWREGGWEADPTHVHETGLRITKAHAKREKVKNGPASQELLRRLQLVYRILLSRALCGIYVWFADDETRWHVESLLKP